MGDSLLVCLVVALGLVGTISVRIYKEPWVSPIPIVLATFFLPMLLATTRLSALQLVEWSYETYVVMVLVAFSWIFVPTLVLWMNSLGAKKFGDPASVNLDDVIRECWRNPTNIYLVRAVAGVVIAAYCLGNYLQSGAIWIINPEGLYDLHHDFPFAIRFFARATPVCVVLLYLAFWSRRRVFDAGLLLAALLIPLSRGSRIDIAMSMVCIIVLFSRFPLFVVTRKRALMLFLAFAVIVAGGVEYGNQRLNRFGQYDVTYDKVIGWKPAATGPAMILPPVYAYFPLSFENFDQAVRQGVGGRTSGVLSFDWFFTGFVKANWLPGYGELVAGARFIPISSGANVPTALLPFYSDFGAKGAAVPMVACMLFWLWAYYRAASSLAWFGVFTIYSGAFALSSFQALIVSPLIAQQLVEIGVLLLLMKKFANANANAG